MGERTVFGKELKVGMLSLYHRAVARWHLKSTEEVLKAERMIG